MDVYSGVVRRRDLVEMPAGDELTLFDAASGRFHTLNGTAARVWQLCDGERLPARLADQLDLPVPYVELALSQFADAGLLDERIAVPAMTRRAALARLAAAGMVGVAALPVVGSITGADGTAAASSPCPPGYDPVNGACFLIDNSFAGCPGQCPPEIELCFSACGASGNMAGSGNFLCGEPTGVACGPGFTCPVGSACWTTTNQCQSPC